MNKFIYGVCTIVELGCILSLAGIGLKRNKDAYEAECKRIKAECDLMRSEMESMCKDIIIEQLEKELEELRNRNKEEA